MTHIVTAGSGIGSGRNCRVIPWTERRTRVFLNDYPFVGGRTPQSMGWVCVEFGDGTLGTFPASRVRPRVNMMDLATLGGVLA